MVMHILKIFRHLLQDLLDRFGRLQIKGLTIENHVLLRRVSVTFYFRLTLYFFLMFSFWSMFV